MKLNSEQCENWIGTSHNILFQLVLCVWNSLKCVCLQPSAQSTCSAAFVVDLLTCILATKLHQRAQSIQRYIEFVRWSSVGCLMHEICAHFWIVSITDFFD